MTANTAEDFPRDYDVIVLGTGMTECIVAAALSRIGQKVLHLDRNDYYSGDWATFNFRGINDWIKKQKGESDDERLRIKDVDLTSLLKEGEKCVELEVESNSIFDVTHHTYIRDKLDSLGDTVESKNSPDQKELSTKCDNSENGTEETGAQSADTTNVSNSNTNSVCDEATDAKTTDKQESTDSLQSKKNKEWTREELDKEFRKFNIDLHPRILYSRGSMVELLISSDIAKYCEFRTVTRILTDLNGKLEQVPCSRSDVFSSKKVTMIEKRMLMKFLTFCIDYEMHPDEYSGFENITFLEFLKQKKLTKTVCHFVQHAIAMVSDSALTIEGLNSAQKFLQSLGRYGNTAFLWPLYGSGELPQCFCRMCAVFGGTYCLKRSGTHLVVDKDNQSQGIIDNEGLRLNSKFLVAESSYVGSYFCQIDKKRTISRGILLTNKSIMEDSDEHISLLSYPSNGCIVTLLELSASSLACPKDIYLVHLSCRGRNTAEEDLQDIIQNLFRSTDTVKETSEDTKPQILWSLFFSQCDTTELSLTSSVPENLFVINSPNLDLDFDFSIQKAREIFDKICPGEDFLPKAPNPEDIIFDDGAVSQNTGSGFETNQEFDDQEESITEENKTSAEMSASQDEVKQQTQENKDPVSQEEIEQLTRNLENI